MSRVPFLLLLGLRAPVHGLVGFAGRIGLIVGLVCLILALDGSGFTYLLAAAAGFIVWWLSSAIRWSYDTTVLRHVPEGESIHLL
mgnify:CR=1 FL=1